MRCRPFSLLSLALLCSGACGLSAASHAQTPPTPGNLPAPFATPSVSNGPQIIPRPDTADLKVPPGFKTEVIAEGLDNPRWLTVAPNGDIFVVECKPGRITLLRTGSGNEASVSKLTFAEGLKQPFGIVVWKNWLYVATPNAILRFAYKAGQSQASGTPEVVVSDLVQTPAKGHWSRTLAVNPRTGKMYVNIGSSFDIGEETDPRRATVLEFNPDGTGQRIYATGLRNAVGLAVQPKSGALWAAVNERDELGDELVPDYVTSVKDGGFYSWPYYYIGANHDPRLPEKPELKSKAIVPDVLLTSHVAALGIVFYNGSQFPGQYRGDAFVALHGSGNRSKRIGYSVIRIPFENGKPKGGYENFLTGWMLGEDDKRVWGRPVGLALAKDGSLLIADDGANKIWRVSYDPQKAAATR